MCHVFQYLRYQISLTLTLTITVTLTRTINQFNTRGSCKCGEKALTQETKIFYKFEYQSIEILYEKNNPYVAKLLLKESPRVARLPYEQWNSPPPPPERISAD